MTRPVLLAVTMIVIGGPAFAEQGRSGPAERRAIEIAKIEVAQIEGTKARMVVAGKIQAAVELKTVTGAPYSGEATTEFVQPLPDGNRIVRQTVVRIFRDSDGRVRREQMSSDLARVESVTIVDPVAGRSVILDPEARTVFGESLKSPSWRVRPEMGTPGDPPARTMKLRAELNKLTQAMVAAGALRYKLQAPSDDKSTRQDLGERNIEGVTARGTRTTTVIPAGAIGNEQPIRVVSEEWYSPDLQVLVQTRHSDPRSGETTYLLTGVNRVEPSRALFEVPADYSTGRRRD